MVQDAFEKLWINKEKVQKGKVKSYLFTTAYHRMIDIIRKNKRISSMEDVNFIDYATTKNQFSDAFYSPHFS